MLRIALLLVLTLPMAACQLALPLAATQVAVPLATSKTVLHGTKQMVEIRTEPPGATVDIPGYPTRTTPTFIMLARGHSHTVTIAKDGFKTVTTDLTSKRGTTDNSNVLGDALDQASGAAWELNPDRLIVKLESLTAVASAAPAPASEAPAQAKGTPQEPATATTDPAANTAAVLAEQLTRLNKLLEQGVITKREHEILVAMAHGATAVAGVTPSP